jgi:hypothetical protein
MAPPRSARRQGRGKRPAQGVLELAEALSPVGEGADDPQHPLLPTMSIVLSLDGQTGLLYARPALQ